MARQAAPSRKRAAPKAVPAATRPGRGDPTRPPQLDGLSADQKVARLLADREALVARIATLESELIAMKSTQADVANRVSWALDTLRDVLATKS